MSLLCSSGKWPLSPTGVLESCSAQAQFRHQRRFDGLCFEFPVVALSCKGLSPPPLGVHTAPCSALRLPTAESAPCSAMDPGQSSVNGALWRLPLPSSSSALPPGFCLLFCCSPAISSTFFQCFI